MPMLPRERKILLLTAAFAVCAALYHFLLDPYFKEWRALSMEIRVMETRLHRTRFLLKKKSEIKGAFQKYSAISEGESSAAMTGILQEVEGLSQKAYLEILELRPLPQKRKGLFKEQGLEVSAEGTASQFAQFVYSLLESPNSLKIERLELSSKSGQDQLLRALIIVTTLTK